MAQLIRVDEPDSSGNLGNVHTPVQPTFYKYNTLGKMIEVTQGVQQRHFLYDSAGRLLRVRQSEQQVNPALNLSNPEMSNTQWTGGFSYDTNGNLLTTTDANNVTTNNSYDALNRIKTRIYSDAVTPTVNFTYDDPNVPFSKGRLTKISSTISETRYKIYDVMGRLTSSEQATDGRIFPTTYKYNLAGNLTEETYPSGRTVKNFLEPNGNLSSISSKTANGQFKTYASNFAYTASSVIERLQIGNGLWESAKMNSRNQVTELRLGTSPSDASLWKLNYDYGVMDSTGTVNVIKNSGNIARQTVTFAGLSQPFVQTYKYDSLDRITEAREVSGGSQTWIQNFGYDRYGNRTQFSQNILGQQMAVNNQTLPTIDADTNKFQAGQGYNYDANGNLIQDYSGRQFTFDGDNKQTLVKDFSNNVVGKYFYDGNGKRVKKVTNSEATIFVYDGSGKLVAEYSTATPVQNPTVNYTATDPLGSPRVLTNSRKEIVSRRDFMPFGEELSFDSTYRTANLKYGANNNVRQKFTGYQRDEETQLDFAEARYYNNSHGRFTAVDPLLASGKSTNPQTFNRYAYTMNRPLILTDPTGLQAGSISDEQIRQIIRDTYGGTWTTTDGSLVEMSEQGLQDITNAVLPEFRNQASLSYQAQWNANDQANNGGISAQTTVKSTTTSPPVTIDGKVEVGVGAERGVSVGTDSKLEGKGKGDLKGAVEVKGTTLVPGTSVEMTDGPGSPKTQLAAANNNIAAGGQRLAEVLDGKIIYTPKSVTSIVNAGPPNMNPTQKLMTTNTAETNEKGLRAVADLASEEANRRNPIKPTN